MKTTYLLLLLSIVSHAQPPKISRQTPVTYFTLADSALVAGKILRQDSAVVVVRLPSGDLTYLQPSQIVRSTTTKPGGRAAVSQATQFRLKDGAVVTGRVLRETTKAVVVRRANGTISYIDPADILSGIPVFVNSAPAANVAGASTAAELAAPYLLSGRTAHTPQRGTVYYRNTYLIRNEAEVGLTNGFSLGVVFNPLVNGIPPFLDRAIYLNADYGTQLYARVGIPIGNRIRLGGVLSTQLQQVAEYGRSGRVERSTQGALRGQVLLSFGLPHSNLTLGYTFRLDDSGLAPQHVNVITIGTIQPLSPRLALVSDNAIRVKLNTTGPLVRLSAGLRVRGGSHAFDLGVSSFVWLTTRVYPTPSSVLLANQLSYTAYPYVGYNVLFGRQR